MNVILLKRLSLNCM